MKLAVGLALFVTLWIHPGSAQDGIEAIQELPGGVRVVNVGSGIYGNNVTIRTAHLSSGAQKSFIDYETVLPSGTLEKYFIYIHHVLGSDDTTRIRLQIWRPIDITIHLYQLVWSRTVDVSIRNPQGILYEYELDDRFRVEANDKIGWTNEESLGPMSFQYVEGHRTFLRKVENNQFPVVNNDYTFDNIHLPSIFSVAVEVNPTVDCRSGFWGQNCGQRCSVHCHQGGGICNIKEGDCVRCEDKQATSDWYTGDMCDVIIPASIQLRDLTIDLVEHDSMRVVWSLPVNDRIRDYYGFQWIISAENATDINGISSFVKTGANQEAVFTHLTPGTNYTVEISVYRIAENMTRYPIAGSAERVTTFTQIKSVSSSTSAKMNRTVIILSSVTTFLVILIVVGVVVMIYRKRDPKNFEYDDTNNPMPTTVTGSGTAEINRAEESSRGEGAYEVIPEPMPYEQLGDSDYMNMDGTNVYESLPTPEVADYLTIL